jgi:hypothetical protein
MLKKVIDWLFGGQPEVIGRNEAVRRLLVNEGIDPQTMEKLPVAPCVYREGMVQ